MAYWSRLPRNPGIYLIDDHRLLAGPPQRVTEPRDDVRIRLRPGADLDEGNELGRIPEVGGDDPAPAPHVRDEIARRLAAPRGDHRRRRTDPVERRVDLVLHRPVGGHRFEDELGRGRIPEIGRSADAGSRRRRVRRADEPVRLEVGEAPADPLHRGGEALLAPPDHHHLAARGREDLGHTVTDEAVADHGHGVEGCGDCHPSLLRPRAEATPRERRLSEVCDPEPRTATPIGAEWRAPFGSDPGRGSGKTTPVRLVTVALRDDECSAAPAPGPPLFTFLTAFL